MDRNTSSHEVHAKPIEETTEDRAGGELGVGSDNPVDPKADDSTNVEIIEDIEEPAEPLQEVSSYHFIDEDNNLPIIIIGPDNQVIRAEDIVLPPDGGWGWVIVFVSFMSNLLIDGMIYSSGVILANIVRIEMENKENRLSPTDMSWVLGMMVGFSMLSGPFASSVTNKIGFRWTAILGSVLSAGGFLGVGIICIGENPNQLAFFILYGGLVGVGFGLMFLPAVISVGYYFQSRRALATGISVCGSGVGTFIFTPLAQLSVDNLGWDWTIIGQSVLLGSIAFLALLYRPIKSQAKLKEKEAASPEHDDRRGSTVVAKIPSSPFLVRMKFASQTEISPTSEFEGGASQMSLKKAASATKQPVLDEEEPAELALVPGSSHSIKPLLVVGSSSRGVKLRRQSRAGSFVSTYSTKSRRSEDDDEEGQDRLQRTQSAMSTNRKTLRLKSATFNDEDFEEARDKSKTITLLLPDTEDDITESRIYRVADKETLNSPFNVTSLFYTGPLSAIPDFDQKGERLAWEAVPVKGGYMDLLPILRKKFRCKCDCHVLRKMLDLSLLKSPTFLILAISGAINFLGFFAPFLFVPALLLEKKDKDGQPKFEASQGTFLISIIGVTNCVGRIFIGLVGDKLGGNIILVSNIACTIGGILTMAIPFFTEYELFATYAAIFGFAAACFISLRSIILVQLLGLGKLTNAFGLLLLFQGSTAMLGSPIAVALKEEGGSFDWSFYFAGGMILLSSIMCYPITSVNNCEARQLAEKELQKMEKKIQEEAAAMSKTSVISN